MSLLLLYSKHLQLNVPKTKAFISSKLALTIVIPIVVDGNFICGQAKLWLFL